jgi:hypothetical protein
VSEILLQRASLGLFTITTYHFRNINNFWAVDNWLPNHVFSLAVGLVKRSIFKILC